MVEIGLLEEQHAHEEDVEPARRKSDAGARMVGRRAGLRSAPPHHTYLASPTPLSREAAIPRRVAIAIASRRCDHRFRFSISAIYPHETQENGTSEG